MKHALLALLLLAAPLPAQRDFLTADEGNRVRDAYGSLTPEEVIDNLYRCQEFVEHRIEEKRGGAGLGLYMLLLASSRAVFNIEPGAFTEVVVLRRYRESGRSFSGR